MRSLLLAFSLVASLGLSVDARFGQEHQIDQLFQNLFQTPTSIADSGKIPTIVGNDIANFLAAGDPCGNARAMDEMVALAKRLPNAADTKKIIEASQRAMHLEKNFNPFVTSLASICLDASLPASNELRGILPLVDPACTGGDAANQKTTQLLEDIISGKVNGVQKAQGKSVAQQMVDLGFTAIQNLNPAAQSPPPAPAAAPAASPVAAPPAAAPPAATPAAANNNNLKQDIAPTVKGAGPDASQFLSQIQKKFDQLKGLVSGIAKASPLVAEFQTTLDSLKSLLSNGNPGKAGGGSSSTTVASPTPAAQSSAPAAQAPSTKAAPAGGFDDPTKALGNVDIGVCKEGPAVEFGAGFDGRKETSYRPVNRNTFPHGSAQNPDIIFEDICNKLNDVCKSPGAKQVCLDIRAKLNGVQPRDGSIADRFNAAFGIRTNFAPIPVIPVG